MTPDTYIDKLLKKYKKAPSFPFEDWLESTVSFYALINFWDELFSVAAGRDRYSYQVLGDATQDINSYIYRVIENDSGKIFSVTPQEGKEIGGMFYLITNPEGSTDSSDNQYDLGFVGDLDRSRLICIFKMIHHYIKNPIYTEDHREQMSRYFIEGYGQYFGFENYNPYNSPLFPAKEILGDNEDHDPSL